MIDPGHRHSYAPTDVETSIKRYEYTSLKDVLLLHATDNIYFEASLLKKKKKKKRSSKDIICGIKTTIEIYILYFLGLEIFFSSWIAACNLNALYYLIYSILDWNQKEKVYKRFFKIL